MSAQQVETAVILAAGRGIRLGDRTREMPKALLEVGGETLIERSVRLLRARGIEKILVGVGHKGTAFEEIQEHYDLTIYHSDDYKNTESLYTLACAREHVPGDFLLLEGDLLYHPSALDRILSCPHENVILGSSFTDAGDEVYLHAAGEGQFRYLTKDPNDSPNAYAELVGINKVSHALYQKMISLPTVRDLPYEYAFNVLSATDAIHVERHEDLVWCEIDDETHLRRAIDVILPRLRG